MEIRSLVADLLADHGRYAWDAEAARLLAALPLHCVPAAEVGRVRDGLCVPVDVPFEAVRGPTADCFGVGLAMVCPFNAQSFPDFEPVPGHDWLWRNRHGALMLAFNLAGFIERFIGFGEERAITARDEHARMPFQRSTLRALGLLQDPVLNKYLFAVLAVAKGRAEGALAADPAAHVLPPMLVLSHDCDQLRGNDWITQAIRVLRFLQPLRRFRLPAFSNLRFLVENFLFPRKYYMDDAMAMSDVEHQFGFRSVFYLLNGIGGRLGARSGSTVIADFVRRLRPSAEIGIHYNYRYAFAPERLAVQIEEIRQLTGRRVRAGRAHYLVIEPRDSFQHLSALDIRVDESMGFAEENSFRQGFAGAYRTRYGVPEGGEPVVEIPMHFMDTNTVPRDDTKDMYRMVAEVEKVGGLVTLLFHPGAFNNREQPGLRGLYLKHLAYFHRKGYRGSLPSEVAALLTAQ